MWTGRKLSSEGREEEQGRGADVLHAYPQFSKDMYYHVGN